jgi:diadenosine tetraphosphate (Ap4A) HIT family hydrolase
MAGEDACELCKPDMVLLEDELAYVRYDNNSLAPGHVLLSRAVMSPTFST